MLGGGLRLPTRVWRGVSRLRLIVVNRATDVLQGRTTIPTCNLWVGKKERAASDYLDSAPPKSGRVGRALSRVHRLPCYAACMQLSQKVACT